MAYNASIKSNGGKAEQAVRKVVGAWLAENPAATGVPNSARSDPYPRYDPDAPANGALAGCQRVRLAPGERRELEIPISDTAFSVVGSDGTRRPGRGKWTLFAGFGQPDRRTAELSGQECLSVTIL